MSKNTCASTFRKIDVDQYNEDNFKEEEQTEPNSFPSLPDENEVVSLLNGSKYYDALRIVLKAAPIGSRNVQMKEKALRLILKVLLSVKSSQIDEIISQLDTEQIDILMKYIYKGFEIPSEGSSAHLLVWHEKAFAVGGLGSIVRVLTDTKRA